ncbi:NUDIX hydrolase [Leptolyngbya sp. 'hensonii']|uniref:NUDIX hydrolase n=1 Tax=Leptolyngbya sp. 'hensonii' TaxID=1922337 RepID=UPI00094FD91F|nr:NUDIX hydrolase [Leptolyngbya sp. 'hensonii']OLP17123.1 NUDIX hydrolase [Leptolyngbya sp. 'hensonii']
MRHLWRYMQAIIGLVFRHPITGVAIIPVLPDGRIVLIRRRDNGRWSIPGGIIDWGEDIPTAARRELVEETGLTLIQIRRLVGVYSAPDRDPRIHSISVVLEAEVQGSLQVQDTLEVLGIKAFSKTDLPLGDLAHDHDRQLRDYLEGRTIVA